MMPNSIRARRVIAPITLSIAAAAFLTAGALVMPSAARAAETQTQSPPATMPAPSSMPRRGMEHYRHHYMRRERHRMMRHPGLERWIRQLHRQLKITPAEERDWNHMKHVMRENMRRIDRAVAEQRAMGPRSKWTALQGLETYRRMAEIHARNMAALTEAFARLYHAMPPAQRKNADRVFYQWQLRHHRMPRHHRG